MVYNNQYRPTMEKLLTYLNLYILQCAAGTLMLPLMSPPRPLRQISTFIRANKERLNLLEHYPSG
jgi:hypothetical protein